MNDSLVISVSRKTRPSETLLRRLMAALGVLFLLAGIMFSTAFMLPCFLTVLCYYWYRHASKREYEYTLEDDTLKIDRVSDRGGTACMKFRLTGSSCCANRTRRRLCPTKRAARCRW